MSQTPTYEQALQFMSDAMLYQRIDLTGPWQGWKIRGQYLVAPDKERIMMRELVGMLIHYRRKFGHHRHVRASSVQQPSNVVAFTSAAAIKPQEPVQVVSPRVQGGALRGA